MLPFALGAANDRFPPLVPIAGVQANPISRLQRKSEKSALPTVIRAPMKALLCASGGQNSDVSVTGE